MHALTLNQSRRKHLKAQLRMPLFSEADRRQILTTQQDKVKAALSQANELSRTEGRQRRRVGGLLLLLLLGFSCWRVFRPRQQPARSQAILKFVRAGRNARRLPMPLKHMLALRNISGLQLVEDEDGARPMGGPAGSVHAVASQLGGQQRSAANRTSAENTSSVSPVHNTSRLCASTSTGCASGTGSQTSVL